MGSPKHSRIERCKLGMEASELATNQEIPDYGACTQSDGLGVFGNQ